MCENVYLKIASSRLTMAHGAVAAPLCMMARWKRSRDSAESKCSETETAPALSPNRVMRFGSKQWKRIQSIIFCANSVFVN